MSNNQQLTFGLSEVEMATLGVIASKILDYTLKSQPGGFKAGDTVLTGFEVRPLGIKTEEMDGQGILIMLAQGNAKNLLREAVTFVASPAQGPY